MIKIGIVKDESNNVVISALMTDDGTGLQTNSLTFNTTNLTECVGVVNVITMGRMASLLRISVTQCTYFSLPLGFGICLLQNILLM